MIKFDIWHPLWFLWLCFDPISFSSYNKCKGHVQQPSLGKSFNTWTKCLNECGIYIKHMIVKEIGFLDHSFQYTSTLFLALPTPSLLHHSTSKQISYVKRSFKELHNKKYPMSTCVSCQFLIQKNEPITTNEFWLPV